MTIWVADGSDRKLYAYTLSSKAHDSSKDIPLHNTNPSPYGIWSDGMTIWVLDNLSTDRIFAYRMSDKSRNSDLEFNTLAAAGVDLARGIWSDGTTMWVVAQDDDKVYSFNMHLAPIRNLSAVPGNRRVELEWDGPPNSTPIRYQYRVSTDGGSNWNPGWTNITNSDAGTTTLTLTGLTNYEIYTLEVRAKRDASTFGPAARRLATPRGPLVAPSNLVATTGQDRRVTLSWDSTNDDSITGYQYRYRNTTDSDWDPDWTDMPGSSFNTTGRILTGLTNNLLYTIEIRPMRGNLGGPAASATATPRGPLIAPPNFAATSGQDEQVTLTWENTGDDTVTVYRHRYRSSADTDWNPDWTDIPGSDANTVTHTLTGLSNNLPYTIEIRAMRDSIEGPVARATATPRGPLVAPPSFAAESGQDRQVTLSWESVGDDSITVYCYRYRARSDNIWDPDWTDIPGSRWDTTSFIVRNLLNRVPYTFEIRAMPER